MTVCNQPPTAIPAILDREDDLIAGSTRVGILNDLLREQLAPTPPAKQANNGMVNSENIHSKNSPRKLIDYASEVVDEILNFQELNRKVLHDKLSQLFYQQKAIYESIPLTQEDRKRQYITQCGLIMSPENCITSILDDLRMRAFIRGVDQAIKKLNEKSSDPIHIAYPACGPFAPLLLPLLGYYKANNLYDGKEQLLVSFIDVQPGAVKTLKALVQNLGVSGYIKDIICTDALNYQPKHSIDIVIIEAMQHGFSREGQFSIARHFAKLLSPEGILLPQEIIITAVLNEPNQEFIEQWRDAKSVSKADTNADILSQRRVLGEIARINTDSLVNSKERVIDQNTVLVEFGKVQIPPLPEDLPEQVLLICSELNVFEDEWLYEYDSGISHPHPDRQVCVNFEPRESRPGDLLVKSGETLQFFYPIYGLPGFLATKAAGEY